MSFEELAKKYLDEILKEYHSRSEWDRRSIGQMVEEKLKSYSDEVKKIIEEKIYNELNELYTPFTQNPEIAIDSVMLSEILYKNAKELSKQVTKILNESIKTKETLGVIAKKLYEGYGFKDKEVLEAIKVLPKYLKEAVKKRDKDIMKQIEKLKTKPLRIAYKDIIRRLDNLSDEELQKYIKTAYYEKMRYYAKRIADTETHRAMMSKRAYEYLNDENIEFVKFTMSSRHPKIDICDFYANLDIGYGRGIVPKKEMRTLPLHPHCHCVYEPYYKEVKGKRKSFKEAVKETMNRFSRKEQKEIVATKEMLKRFEEGENIEKIFNAIRPKYPIKKYIDIFKGVEYNSFMRKYEEKILEKFNNFDVSSKEKAIESFKKLWNNEKSYVKHLEKRKKLKHIEDELDYLNKTLKCLENSKECLIAVYDEKDIWDRIRYFDNEEWIVIFAENGTLLTSHKKEKTELSFEEKHKKYGAIIKKGEIDEKFRKFFKELRNKFRIF